MGVADIKTISLGLKIAVAVAISAVVVAGFCTIYLNTADADTTDIYSFTWNGYTVEQKGVEGTSVVGSFTVTTINYSLSENGVSEEYSIGYILGDGKAIVGTPGNGDKVYVNGTSSIVIIPPKVKYDGKFYVLDTINSRIAGTSNNSVKKLCVVPPENEMITLKNSFQGMKGITELIIDGKISVTDGNLTSKCTSLQKIDIGSIGSCESPLCNLTGNDNIESLTISFKSSDDTRITKILNGVGKYNSVTLILKEGSKKALQFGLNEITKVAVHAGDPLWKSGNGISGIAEHVNSASDSLVFVAYGCATVASADNGTISVPSGKLFSGEDVDVTVQPNEGYALSRLYYTIGDEETEITGTSFKMPAADIQLHAVFKASDVEIVSNLIKSGAYASLSLTVTKSSEATHDPSKIRVQFRFSNGQSADSFSMIESTIDCSKPYVATLSSLHPEGKQPVECLIEVFGSDNVMIGSKICHIQGA